MELNSFPPPVGPAEGSSTSDHGLKSNNNQQPLLIVIGSNKLLNVEWCHGLLRASPTAASQLNGQTGIPEMSLLHYR